MHVNLHIHVYFMVVVLKFRTPNFLTKWQIQTVYTLIRILLKELSDQVVHHVHST